APSSLAAQPLVVPGTEADFVNGLVKQRQRAPGGEHADGGPYQMATPVDDIGQGTRRQSEEEDRKLGDRFGRCRLLKAQRASILGIFRQRYC
ncbi:MAG TPA: hypothetical protein VFD73_00835, partial [Gemmatimonadales bacterium]|nr:hypothetical protein [Gemmatimonadales bacterium]